MLLDLVTDYPASTVDDQDLVDELTRLLLEAKRGDRAALENFVRRTQPEIWRFCARIVGLAEADDATQETYVGAWRSLASFRGDSSARTWLFVIARRTAFKILRRRERWAEAARRSEGRVSFPNEGSLVEVDELLAVLDADRRAALVLTQVIGFSYAETAEICQCPVGTVRSRVARARGDLLEHARTLAGNTDADAG